MGAITRAAANNITTGGVILPAGINDTSVASISELEQVATVGGLNLISSQTASASASIEFTSGIDSTYDIYKFEFIDIHPATNGANFEFNMSTDGGSTYAVTKTTTYVDAYHIENDTAAGLEYYAPGDLAQSTAYQTLGINVGNGADETISGQIQIFNPSSNTFVKHFISRANTYYSADYSLDNYVAGYGNTTSAVNAIQFKMSSGNIDAGTIRLYGIQSS